VKRIHFRPDAECATRTAVAAGFVAIDALGAGETTAALRGVVRAGVAVTEAGGLSLALDYAKTLGFRTVPRAYKYFSAVAGTQDMKASVTLSLGAHVTYSSYGGYFPEFSYWGLVPFVGSARAVVAAVKACVSIE